MPISPDTHYSLSGSVQCLHITPDIYHGAFASNLDIDAVVDGTTYVNFGEVIEAAVLRWRQTTSDERRAYMAAHGFADIPMQVSEAVDTLLNVLARAELDSRAIPIPRFLCGEARPRIQLGDRYDDAIERLIVDWRIDQWARKLGEQHQRTVEALLVFADIEQFRAAVEQVVIHYGCTTFAREDAQVCDWGDTTQDDPMDVGPVRVVMSTRDRRRARRIINRGIRAFTEVLGSRDICAFISQRSTTIEGVRYNYKLLNEGNIVHHTLNPTRSVPFGLNICDKQGKKLAYACVYIPGTPIIDQILALALNVRDAESEVEFLEKAHLFTLDWEDPDGRALGILAGEPQPRKIMGSSGRLFEPFDDCCSPEDMTPATTAYYTELERTINQLGAVWQPHILRRIREISGIPSEVFRLMGDACRLNDPCRELAVLIAT